MTRPRVRRRPAQTPTADPVSNYETDDGTRANKLRDEINAKMGARTVQNAAHYNANQRYIPMGHLVGDLALLGGIPEGQSAMFLGNEGGGKTSQAMRCVGEAQKKYPNARAYWIETEQTFDPVWAASLGVDLSRLEIVEPFGAEDAIDVVKTIMAEIPDACMIAVDSVSQLVPTKEYDESVSDAHVALLPRLLGRMCSRLTSASTERRNKNWMPVTRIMVNQWRSRIGGPPMATKLIPGGAQLKYHCSTHLDFRAKKDVKSDADGFQSTNVVTHTIVVKRTKLSSSIVNGDYRVIVGPDEALPIGAIDEAGTITAYAKKLDMYHGTGQRQYFTAFPDTIFRKADDAKDWLEDNPASALEVKRAIIQHRRQRVGLQPLPLDGYLLRW